MSDLENKIKHIADKALLPEQNIINVTSDVNSGYIRIVLDGEKNVSLKETTSLTRILKNSEEFDSLFPNGYRLEVTSPGLDHPLEYPFQYKKNIGKHIDISLFENRNNIKLSGLIFDADDDFFFLKVKNKTLKLSYGNIISAKLKILFK